MKNAILINLPLTETLYPSASLASIIPIFKSNNYQVEVIDLNLELAEEFLTEEVDKIYSWCELTLDNLEFDLEIKLSQWLEHKMQYILDDSINVLAVSVFSIYSVKISKL